MPTIQSQGLTVHYTDAGRGEPVVLLHAGGSSSTQWRKLSPMLQNRFRLLAPDLIGFGETEAWRGTETLSHDHQATLVRDLIAHTAPGPVHAVGHSYGGATALRLAIGHGDSVRRLVLIEPIMTSLLRLVGETELFAELAEIAEQFFAVSSAAQAEAAWRRFIDYRNGDGTWNKMSDKARARFLAQTAQTAAAFRSNLNNATTLEQIREIALPTLVLCGANTTKPDRCITEILRDHIPGCEYRTISEAEHMSPLTHPEPVAEAIREHLLADG